MSRQWIIVILVVGGLVLGGAAVVRFSRSAEVVGVGAEAPAYPVVNVRTGDTLSLGDYKGTVTLINIWATWCAPCRVEMPAIERAYRTYAPRGFRIAAVSIDQDGPADVRRFADSLGLTFDILQDRTTNIQQTYQTTGVPESFLVNQQGVIVKRVIGAYDWDSEMNRRLIARLLDDAGAPPAPAAPADSAGRFQDSSRTVPLGAGSNQRTN